jgi:hypothetical protein
MTCSVVARDKIYAAATECSQLEHVVAADCIQPSADRHAWALEVVCHTEAVPPEVMREIVLAELDYQPSLSGVQGDCAQIVATA